METRKKVIPAAEKSVKLSSNDSILQALKALPEIKESEQNAPESSDYKIRQNSVPLLTQLIVNLDIITEIFDDILRSLKDKKINLSKYIINRYRSCYAGIIATLITKNICNLPASKTSLFSHEIQGRNIENPLPDNAVPIGNQFAISTEKTKTHGTLLQLASEQEIDDLRAVFEKAICASKKRDLLDNPSQLPALNSVQIQQSAAAVLTYTPNFLKDNFVPGKLHHQTTIKPDEDAINSCIDAIKEELERLQKVLITPMELEKIVTEKKGETITDQELPKMQKLIRTNRDSACELLLLMEFELSRANLEKVMFYQERPEILKTTGAQVNVQDFKDLKKDTIKNFGKSLYDIIQHLTATDSETVARLGFEVFGKIIEMNKKLDTTSENSGAFYHIKTLFQRSKNEIVKKTVWDLLQNSDILSADQLNKLAKEFFES